MPAIAEIGPEVMLAWSARTPINSMLPMISATASEIEVIVMLYNTLRTGLANAHPWRRS